MRWTWIMFCGVALGGCFAPSKSSDTIGYMDDDFPAGMCASSGGSSGSSIDCGPHAVGSACKMTTDCNAGLVCAAPFDGDVGAFVCSASCIGLEDEAQWCADDVSCCDPAAHCSARGYCLLDDGSATSTGGAAGGSTSGGSGAVPTSGTGSNAGTGTGTGTATGTGTGTGTGA